MRVVTVLVLCFACADEPDDCRCPSGERCDIEGVCRPSCADDDDCTMCEACRMGVCFPLSSCRCETTADCDDNDPCNGEELCDSAGRCITGVPFECSPSSNDCFDNVCVSTAGAPGCELRPSGACPCDGDADCDDYDGCNGDESCIDGHCWSGVPFECPPATVACRVNSCIDDAGTPRCQLRLAATDALCDDDVACTDGSCDVTGVCVGHPTVCDDGVDCTDDSCDEVVDQCVFVTDDTACDDNATCTTDTCDPLNDCVFSADHTVCDDNNVCTNNRCQPGIGEAITGCSFPTNAAPCDDDNPCTGPDTCQGGNCQGELLSDFVTCDGGAFCLAGVCVIEISAQYDPPSSPCVQDWRPVGLEKFLLLSGHDKFVAGINATFRENGVECVTSETYFYGRALSGAELHDTVQLRDVDFALIDRVLATGTAMAGGLATAWGPGFGAGLAEVQSSQISFEINPSTVNLALGNTLMEMPHAVARVDDDEFFVGGVAVAGEGMISHCANPGGGYHWVCDSSNRLAVTLRTDNTVVAMVAAVDPSDDSYDGLIIALQNTDGTFSLAGDMGTGLVASVVAGGPWAGEVHGAVGRAWDDVFFFGNNSVIVECTSPPDWVCAPLESPRSEWDIAGGAASPSGHLFLVGPFFVAGSPSVYGNRLIVLPDGSTADDPMNWITLPMSETVSQRPSAIVATENEIQVLGIQHDTSNGDRLLMWSYEPP